jgi:hypothetical protein
MKNCMRITFFVVRVCAVVIIVIQFSEEHHLLVSF